MKHTIGALLFALAITPTATTATLAASKYATVMEADSVNCTIEKGNPEKSKPSKLEITATGKVNSTGWSEGQLSPHVYITPPADGIWDLTFMARKPRGVVIWVTTPIAARDKVDMPSWVKGVRVHSSTNNTQTTCPSPQNENLSPDNVGDWTHR